MKPSQDIALLEDQLAAESSDDSEYKQGNSDHSGGNSSTSSNDNSSSSSEDDDDDGDETSEISGEAAALKKEDHEVLTTRELLALSKQELDSSSSDMPLWVSKIKVCGCCLGESSTDANEIVECDGCGISVHEGCYGITESTGSIASTISSASTEPWFCEPCRAGLEQPPVCELCPLVGGVYKETDVGKWVHLICALYIPGVAFGDTENMTTVTVFEMNYANWGRKACSLCSQQADLARFCRTGVCIQCDAGLCKAYFHASCAQAAGFLCEPTYVTSSLSEHVMDAYLAHCKVHTDKTVVKRRRRASLVHQVQARLRRAAIINRRDKLPNVAEREHETAEARVLRKLSRHRVRFVSDKAKKHDPWVPTQKMPRLLTTSASAIRKIQRMGVLHDLDVERQTRQEVQIMSIVEAKKKWGIAPAFNVEFLAYYEDRQRRIQDLKKQISQDLAQHESLKNSERSSRPSYDKAIKSQSEAFNQNSQLRKVIETYRTILGVGGQNIPSIIPAIAKPAVQPSFPPIRARATAWSLQQSQVNHNHHNHSVKSCGICKKTHDQHILAHCDTCQLHYHLGCLTPPLTRMPKKSKQYGWSCSECYPDSSSDEEAKLIRASEELANNTEGPNGGKARTQRRRRVAASKALLANSTNNSDFDDDIFFLDEIPPAVVKKAAKVTKRKTSAKKLPNGQNKPTISAPSDSASIPAAVPTDDTLALPSSSKYWQPKESVLSAPINISLQDDLIAKAAAKAERKRLKKAEKERRKAEKREKKRQMKMMEEEEEGDDDDDDVEIVEDENGQCTVRIKPKPIKLTIKTGLTNGSSASAGIAEEALEDVEASPPPSKKRRKRTHISPDTRTKCDKCQEEGSNVDLVRCDECKRCYHFGCLTPPLKKSPKVTGYGWHCNECDPSDVDTDWHLD